jgi:D-alanine-D-alanine ligase
MSKPLRVLLLCHPDAVPRESLDGLSRKEAYDIKSEHDVCAALRECGHEVLPLGVQYDLKPIRDAIEEWHPDVVFNLLIEFHGEVVYGQNIASFLELMRVPYTGCNPRGLVLAQGKDLSKKLLKYHRIPTPAFAVFPMARKVKRPGRLRFPLIVKSTIEDASMGISQASVVDNDKDLDERVRFIHGHLGTAAIAEQYIDGRELYVGVMGNERLKTLPVWELRFERLAPGALPIATERVKRNPRYQEERGVVDGPAADLPPELVRRISDITKRICRVLELDGYVRIDYRLGKDGVPYFIEANPNPEIARGEEFAQSAAHDGIAYPDLINRIVSLAIARTGAEDE